MVKARRKRRNTKSLACICKMAHANCGLWNLIGPNNKNKNQRAQLIESLNQKQVCEIQDVVKAFLDRKIDVPPNVISKLKKDKAFLYEFCKSNTPLREKKEMIYQKGGFLPFLLPLLIGSGVTGAVVKFAGKKIAKPILKAVVKKGVNKLERKLFKK